MNHEKSTEFKKGVDYVFDNLKILYTTERGYNIRYIEYPKCRTLADTALSPHEGKVHDIEMNRYVNGYKKRIDIGISKEMNAIIIRL